MYAIRSYYAKQGLSIYLQRMKIEECFRDMKNLLGLEKLMNKRRDHMEKMVALLLIAYAIALWLGEMLRSANKNVSSPNVKYFLMGDLLCIYLQNLLYVR